VRQGQRKSVVSGK